MCTKCRKHCSWAVAKTGHTVVWNGQQLIQSWLQVQTAPLVLSWAAACLGGKQSPAGWWGKSLGQEKAMLAHQDLGLGECCCTACISQVFMVSMSAFQENWGFAETHQHLKPSYLFFPRSTVLSQASSCRTERMSRSSIILQNFSGRADNTPLLDTAKEIPPTVHFQLVLTNTYMANRGTWICKATEHQSTVIYKTLSFLGMQTM